MTASRTARFLALSLLFLVACRADPEPVITPDAPETPREAAARLVREGELEEAHAALSGLLADEHLAEAERRLAADDASGAFAELESALALVGPSPRSEALRDELETELLHEALREGRALLEDGNAPDAMLALDEGVSIAPDDPELRYLRGCATLLMGRQYEDEILFEDAVRNFRTAARSGERPAAWYGLAQSEFQLYTDDDPARIARALAALRRGGTSKVAGTPDAFLLPDRPVRTACRVLMWASSLAADGKLVDEDPAALREEWREAAGALVGIEPDDAWAWNQVALSHEWDGDPATAADVARRGVLVVPEDATLHETLTRCAREAGGDDAVLSVYTQLAETLPEVAEVHRRRGRAAFDTALAKLEAEPSDQSERFTVAEEAYRRARELDGSLEQEALGYEVVARAGQGWSHYHAGRLDAARDAFLATEELMEGGLDWNVEGRLRSGLVGLENVVGRYYAQWIDEDAGGEERLRALEKAAELSDRLLAYDPENGAFANNAGFFHRDAGVALEGLASQIVAELEGEDAPTGEERAAALERARSYVARAEEHVEKSYAAYLEAVRLFPDDPRTINDCALIQAYYLREDAQVAEELLLDAVDVAKRLKEEGELDEDQAFAVDSALGDAYENLGYLELTMKKRPIYARNWFEKALETGPVPRPIVNTEFLPDCEKLLKEELSDAEIEARYRWPVDVPAE